MGTGRAKTAWSLALSRWTEICTRLGFSFTRSVVLQELLTPLRRLARPARQLLGARLAAWDRSTLLLGASGIGLAVLSALLYSSRRQNQCANYPAFASLEKTAAHLVGGPLSLRAELIQAVPLVQCSMPQGDHSEVVACRRLQAMVMERDQDIAKMVSRIFQLKEALQPRRIPIIHHVGASAGLAIFPSYPALDIL